MAGTTINQSDWDGGNFELLRPDAKRVVALAHEEILRSGPRFGTLGLRSGTIEHLLIGLAEAEGPAQALLSGSGIDADTARERLGIGRNSSTDSNSSRFVVPTSRLVFAIRLGFQVARRLSSQSVGGEHLLLAILVDGESDAAHFLEASGVGLDVVCQRLGLDPEVVGAASPPIGF